MLASDSEDKWPSKLLTDPRVVHYWDADKLVGEWYGENVTVKKSGHVEWDAYFLYKATSEWGEDGPSEQISWGRTIVDTRKQLQEDLFTTIPDEIRKRTGAGECACEVRNPSGRCCLGEISRFVVGFDQATPVRD